MPFIVCTLVEGLLSLRLFFLAVLYIYSSYRIADIGTARIMGAITTHATTRIGTTLYDPPEFLNNEPYSYPLDVWSLGVVISEMCTLQHPFADKSPAKMLMNILTKPPTPIPQITNNTSASMSFILSH